MISKSYSSYDIPKIENIDSYLSLSGWHIDAKRSSELVKVWKADHSKSTLLAPANSQLIDYDARVMEIFEELSRIEKRPFDEILKAANFVNFDVTSFRFVGQQYNDGTIPLEKVGNLITGVLESFQASTKAVNKLGNGEKKSKHNKFAGEASKLMRSLKMGQTQKGSFIVNIMTPIPAPKPQNEDLLRSEIPYPRLVTQQLSKSVNALYSAASDYSVKGDELAFHEAVKFGVNASLCDALIDMGETDFNSVEITNSWSKRVEVEPDLPQKVKFTHSILPSIEAASAFYKRVERPKSAVIMGKVTVVRIPEGQESGGTITINAKLDGGTRTVTAKLGEALLQEAIKLAAQKRNMTLYGDLDLSGKNAVLNNPYTTDELDIE